MRFTLEPSPAGGFHVRLHGIAAPLSHHDTEEEAERHRLAYERGAGAPPAGEIADLPDGSEVLIRPVRPQDKPLFAAGWERFGEESRYRRFMGYKTAPLEGELDAWQGRGLGGALLRRRKRRATANGITTFRASLLTGNRSMLHLFERLGAVRIRAVEGGVMEIDVELPVEESRTLLRSAATGHVGHSHS
jgi:GNAT superfamily N-acetyltransferase